MTRTIWKYPLAVLARDQKIYMPEGSIVLDVQMKGHDICLWVLLNPEHPLRERFFRVVGTGHRITSDVSKYHGTVQLSGFVWHVFEIDAATVQDRQETEKEIEAPTRSDIDI